MKSNAVIDISLIQIISVIRTVRLKLIESVQMPSKKTLHRADIEPEYVLFGSLVRRKAGLDRNNTSADQKNSKQQEDAKPSCDEAAQKSSCSAHYFLYGQSTRQPSEGDFND